MRLEEYKLEKCKIGKVQDWKTVRLEECKIRKSVELEECKSCNGYKIGRL